jgi:hypothetical protein
MKYPGSVIWISGDANLPDIAWKTMSVVGHHNPAQFNSLFMDTVMDMADDEIVDLPTRGQIFMIFHPQPTPHHQQGYESQHIRHGSRPKRKS